MQGRKYRAGVQNIADRLLDTIILVSSRSAILLQDEKFENGANDERGVEE